ncbi:TIGR03089 family protein [Rhodococcus sp. BP-149]|uniref:TIGR03089 family protein n=1 Tax=unclassified Rhodococcus (in: high G+C Gram-positive bacteria) TaxID=192944 RepID=UPI001C9B4786|nr:MULTISPECIES: TIGR03089 family protein [unclassified Rhodococcus (in: high G+C Gram-positive bacteria)]MBY6683864.1 TIGR03089 family protein [Rhodococcus sp. BP-288]MBY6695021.1 TIGR03089 family protein [Rhodococcus sp. BP-188]MBY6697672.1 TIGR03089 family protein [Rhodococcus sp. BP-285]MBY6702349.1 TIGR03089 family protein [Rhodococcus sp. BP-283]MBY6709718.1 TIGR03089 family protein [Rhodococcus sp. BP-160]
MTSGGTTLTDALLGPILAADAAGPRITYYDDSTGERIELSALTLANWAAKTANFLRDELGVSPGDVVSVVLPAHWQTASVLLGAWWAGAEVILRPDPDAAVALVTASGVETADAGEVAALSLDPFGRPVDDLPLGVTDYATSVRVHGDQFVPVGAGPALEGRSVQDVLTDAQGRAAARGLSATDRVLATGSWDDADGLLDGLVAVLAAGASLVQVTALDPAALDRRVATEKVTTVLE